MHLLLPYCIILPNYYIWGDICLLLIARVQPRGYNNNLCIFWNEFKKLYFFPAKLRLFLMSKLQKPTLFFQMRLHRALRMQQEFFCLTQQSEHGLTSGNEELFGKQILAPRQENIDINCNFRGLSLVGVAAKKDVTEAERFCSRQTPLNFCPLYV